MLGPADGINWEKKLLLDLIAVTSTLSPGPVPSSTTPPAPATHGIVPPRRERRTGSGPAGAPPVPHRSALAGS